MGKDESKTLNFLPNKFKGSRLRRMRQASDGKLKGMKIKWLKE
jgi:hypothetical protein